MCSFPPPGFEGGFRQGLRFRVQSSGLYSPGFFFYSWCDLEIGKIYPPPGLEGANLVVYQPIGTRGQLSAQVGSCAGLFAPEFPLVHVLFLEGYCVWNQLVNLPQEFPSLISDQVVKRFRFIPISG